MDGAKDSAQETAPVTRAPTAQGGEEGKRWMGGSERDGWEEATTLAGLNTSTHARRIAPKTRGSI
jgi:hypothetical protein